MGSKGGDISIEGLDDIGLTLVGDPDNPITTKILGDANQPVTMNTQMAMVGDDTRPLTFEMRGNASKPIALKTEMTMVGDANKPVTMKTSTDMAMNSTSQVDIRPLVMDTCMTMKLAPLPETCIQQPYVHRIAFSFLGAEILGVSFSGEKQTRIERLKKTTTVAHDWRDLRSGEAAHEHAPTASAGAGGSGIKIKLQ